MRNSNKEGLLALLIGLIAIIIFIPSLSYEFTYDDIGQVVQSEYVTSDDKSVKQILSAFTLEDITGTLYRPITSLSLRLNYLLSGLDPWSYHAINILLHGLVTYLVFFLALITLNNIGIASFSALLFAVHPIHIEAIANVYNRTELLAAFFSICCIFAYLKSWQSKKQSFMFLSAVLYLLACLSKESALTTLGLAPLVLFYSEKLKFNKDNIFKVAKFSLPLVLIAVACLYIRFLVLDTDFLIVFDDDLYRPENPLFQVSIIERIVPSLFLFGEYLRTLLFPFYLSIDYSPPNGTFIDHVYSSYGLGSILIALAFIVVALFQIKKRLFHWFLWVFLSFSLTINFITAIGTIMAERLAYVPSIGFTIILVAFLFKLKDFSWPYLTHIFIVAYFAFTSYVSCNRLPIWKDNFTLFDHAYEENKSSPKIAFVRGMIYYKSGDYQTAIESYKETIFRDPSIALPARFIIQCYLKLEDYPRAAFWTKKYLEVNPDDQEVQKIAQVLLSKKKQQDIE